MSKYVHFVIAVNLDTKEVIVDDDTFTAKFPDGGLYDDDQPLYETINGWRDETEDEGELARQIINGWEDWF